MGSEAATPAKSAVVEQTGENVKSARAARVSRRSMNGDHHWPRQRFRQAGRRRGPER